MEYQNNNPQQDYQNPPQQWSGDHQSNPQGFQQPEGTYYVQRQVGFVEAIKMGFSKYATFRGRSSRSEFWWWQLFNLLILIIPAIILCIGIAQDEDAIIRIAAVLFGVIILGLLIPNWAIVFRRFHDIGKSGSVYVALAVVNAIAGFIPYVGAIISLGISILLLVWYCKASEPEDNYYGDIPNATYYN